MAYLTAEKKQELFGKYGKSNTDTGSPESQIALFSYRINHLTEHVSTTLLNTSRATSTTSEPSAPCCAW